MARRTFESGDAKLYTHVCVGGPLDGMTRENAMEHRLGFTEAGERYIREDFATPIGAIFFWRYAGMNIHEAVLKLLGVYQRKAMEEKLDE